MAQLILPLKSRTKNHRYHWLSGQIRLLHLVMTVLWAVFGLLLFSLTVTPAWADLGPDPIPIGIDQNTTTSLAWGDLDNDGDLDLAIGNDGAPNRVYRNVGGSLQTNPVWTANIIEATQSVAWGDMNGDGYLDLAVGNTGTGERNRVYLNLGGNLQINAAWVSPIESEYTHSVAWGDMDKDGDLDLATGNAGPERVYRNVNNSLTVANAWISPFSEETTSVAWGDMDGDGWLDLAIGNWDGTNRVYRNAGGVLTSTNAWVASVSETTESVVWGDINGDKKLDLVVGNSGDYDQTCPCFLGAPNRVYLNLGNILETNGASISPDEDVTLGIDLGDWDSDGDLDLAANNWLIKKVYRNEGGTFEADAVWSYQDDGFPEGVAWGDVDNDGDLDLASGNKDGTNNLYLNRDSILETSSTSFSNDFDQSTSAAWGDVDRDGDLDLVVGNGWTQAQPSKLYLNNNGILNSSPAWSSPSELTSAVAWGDIDGDKDLDLAIGNGCVGNPPICYPSRVYRNDGMINNGQTAVLTPVWVSNSPTDGTASVAWGDMDGDLDLDLAVGNWGNESNTGAPNKIYLNQNGVLQATPVWTSTDSDQTHSVAWGDLDGDGDLDLAAGNRSASNKVYFNEGRLLNQNAGWVSGDSDRTRSIAWGDVDGDGDLDLAAGNSGAPNKFYLNNQGILQTIADNPWTSGTLNQTWSVAWGDVDGDGDLDLAAGGENKPNQFYQNRNRTLQAAPAWVSTDENTTMALASGDVDGDGDLDLAMANQGQPEGIYYNRQHEGSPLINNPPWVTITRPGSTANAAFYSTAEIIRLNQITIAYKLFDAEGNPVSRIFPEFSANGGGKWLPATPGTGGDGLINLAASPGGTPHTFSWNVKADLIKSDNVVFRIRAQPGYRFSPIQWPAVGSQTFPFRVEADWYAQVITEEGQPVAGASVYLNGQLVTVTTTTVTDKAGLIRLNNPIPGVPLLALAPTREQTTTRAVHEGWAYRIYITNLKLNNQGAPQPDRVGQPGKQKLIVHQDDPLILFNLVASVEWDASTDYLAMLTDAFRKASAYLYDLTDGQMALGQVTIYDKSRHWSDADIQFSTKNTVRPYAFIGGITSGDEAHAIRLGRFWDGGSGNQGLWNQPPGYRTIIHEFGHYALYLYDQYFVRGVDSNGNFTGDLSATCTSGAILTNGSDGSNASPMFFQYNASELSDKTFNWSEDCQATEQARLNNDESDWETVLRRYGGPTWKINTPSNRGSLMVGPTRFPTELLPFPKISLHNDGVSGGLIRKLTVRNPQGQPVLRALVALYTSLNGVSVAIDQGLTNSQGQIDLYGAAPGDRIRVATFNGALAGTIQVNNADNYQLTLSPTSTSDLASQNTNPSPYLTLIPDTRGDRLTLEVHGAANGGNLLSVIIPGEGGGSPQSAPLVYSPILGAYTSQVELAGVGLGSGSVQVSGVAGNQAVFINSNYNLQAVQKSKLNNLYSEDGNFELHIPPEGIPANGYATVLPTGYVPGPLPDGKQVIGSAYQVGLSGSVVELEKEGSVRLHYHPQVMGVYTNTAIYYWHEAKDLWQAQGGTPDDVDNSLSVPVTRPGIYALMGVQIAGANRVYLPVIKKAP